MYLFFFDWVRFQLLSPRYFSHVGRPIVRGYHASAFFLTEFSFVIVLLIFSQSTPIIFGME